MDGKNGGFHAWKILHTTTAAITITGAYTQLLHHTSPESLLSIGARKTEDKAAKRLHKYVSFGAWLPRDMPGFLCGSQATVNKLSHCVGLWS